MTVFHLVTTEQKFIWFDVMEKEKIEPNKDLLWIKNRSKLYLSTLISYTNVYINQ